MWRKRRGLETRTKPLLSEVFTKTQMQDHRERIVKRAYHKKKNEISIHIGDTCVICGAHYQRIHRKDGRKHDLFIKTPWEDLHDLLRLTGKHYAPVCPSCHANVHKYMKQSGMSWQEAAKLVRKEKALGL